MRKSIPVFIAWLAAVLVPVPALAAAPSAVRTEHVAAELVSERSAFVPGATTTVALRLRMAKGWHTYWQNPGDSGLPTRIEWTLPAGLSAGAIQWPYPHALPTGPLVNYGYEGEVLLLVDIAAAASAAVGTPLTIGARADWLVCRETCIPETAELGLTLPVERAAAAAAASTAFANTRAALPVPLPASWKVEARGEGPRVDVRLSAPAGVRPDLAGLRFYPFAEGRVEAAARQMIDADGTGWRLLLPVANQLAPDFSRLAGVLVSPGGFADPSLGKAVAVDVPLVGRVSPGVAPAAVAAPLDLGVSPAPGGSLSLAMAVVLAFGGGLLLNLMPCVFPILSLKVLGFARHDPARPSLRGQGLAFAGGVVVSFWILAAALVALRSAGEQLGWGFQLQSPAVVSALAAVFFLLALNLSGIFEIGMLLPSGAASARLSHPLADAFASGVLAVVVASPCTAPFMGAALGYALAQPGALTLTVFTALGLGMALPYLLLSWFPAWRQRLPRPGAWMVRLKEFLAFPLYATVVWLAWVLGVQAGVDAMLRLLAALVVLALAAWFLRLAQRSTGTGYIARGLAVLACALSGWVAWPLGVAALAPDSGGAHAVSAEKGDWQPYSAAKVTELNAAGKTVFVDFTAAWCVTCQVNKQLVLRAEPVLSAFAGRGVVLLRADWTRQDPEITRALRALGRSGVPVYVFYVPGASPVLLPELLQQSTVIDALAALPPPAPHVGLAGPR